MQGSTKGKMELPEIFMEQVREDLIRRAVVAELSLRLQPQGHFPLAGMNTTAAYYGAMGSYRTGRHMGIAIRPRQKLAGGRQGEVRRIPSARKGKRAHPHVIEKTLVEEINNKEYQKAIRSAIAATARTELVKSHHRVERAPFILSDEMESMKKAKDVMAMFSKLKLDADVEKSHRRSIRKGQRRLSIRRHFRNTVLIVVKDDKGIIKAARNIPGVDACTTGNITAALLAPGGVPGRITVWSESAVKGVADEVAKLKLRR
jgi:large subunit ribosomal protein L4e